MKFTGERYIPDTPGHLTTKHEHMHRYSIAAPLAAGKDVLDIASGEGYGAALLARAACSVTGVDIDRESVEHASSEYRALTNLKFTCGSCAAIPLEADAVDMVTSFETIEHHDQHEEMMLEVRRVLRPGGVLLLSSPNRKVYTEELGNVNEHHVKELDYDELCDLLSRHFPCVRVYGQRLAAASFITPLAGAERQKVAIYSGPEDDRRQGGYCLPSPAYYLALCSDTPERVDLDLSSLFLDPAGDLWQATQETLRQTQGQHLQSLEKLANAESVIASMTASRFWRLRAAWQNLTGRG